MRLLLDTHILVWLVSDDPQLPARLRQSLHGHELVLSAASIWELSIKHHLGKLPSVGPILDDLDGVAANLGAAVLDISAAHAVRAGALEWAHRDPFDRMLVAQALEGGLRLVTLDERITSHAGAPVFAWAKGRG